MSAAEKIHYIGEPKDSSDASQPQGGGVQTEIQNDNAYGETQRDMSKVALFVSILSVVLLVVFFFGLNQNLKGVSSTVEQLSVSSSDLTSRIAGVEDKLVALESLPHKSKMMVMSTMLQEMAQRAAFLSTQMDTPEQNDKLQSAMELLQQVQTQIEVE